jgi:serine/threonine protein kinase
VFLNKASRSVRMRIKSMVETGLEPVPGYCLTHRLGQGGCGEVWEAMHKDGSVVALKFIDCRNQSRTLVANEIRMLLKLRDLRHPQIIQMHDVCATRQYIVLIMDRADGNLLELEEVYLQETGKHIPCEHMLDLLEQAAEALDFLAEHSRPGLASAGHGMQHCDVKPSNLLVLNDSLKVADFGLCMSSLSATHGKRFMGTPPYAAPELYEGKVTTHTDQYALAVTFAQLATGGRALFPPMIASCAWYPPVDLRKLRVAECPVIARALDPNWMNRWPSCKAFLAALRQALDRPRSSGKKLGSRQLQRLRGPV